ncbi:unnamed protein product [Didymodactylos carnosus]|uniref:Uncharacterized protein n=1 Tax=Didymodactylos carnosus TaxID=1234261 RepID=A0A8S2H8Z4_9BILA|nr:unnamed protein product [Didymodactylos carnosus]CAF3610269.1 unnamed protein product [Didymodactylos carnosus]
MDGYEMPKEAPSWWKNVERIGFYEQPQNVPLRTLTSPLRTPSEHRTGVQFRSSIQIKEIPNGHDEEYVETWEPSMDKVVLGKPVQKSIKKFIVVGFIIGSILLIGAAIGIGTGLVLSQKVSTTADNSLTYNAICTVNSQQFLAEYTKTIRSLSWHQYNADLLVVVADEIPGIIIWNVEQQKSIQKLYVNGNIEFIDWNEENDITFILNEINVYRWHVDHGDKYDPLPGAQNFKSSVTSLSFHRKVLRKFACGHADGSISIFSADTQKRHILIGENISSEITAPDSVSQLDWDPLSMNYLLILKKISGITLFDAETLTIINTFELPRSSAKIRSLQWLPDAPGLFITGDTDNGVLRIWTASQATSLESITIKKSGFHAFLAFIRETVETTDITPVKSLKKQKKIHYPKVQILCAFSDGGIGVYELQKKSWMFLRDEGHVETIFDCRFHSTDPDKLATASFDGTVKVWDISTMTSISTSPGNEGIIYNISWMPGHNLIAAATCKNGVWLYDTDQGKVIKRFVEVCNHAKIRVYYTKASHPTPLKIFSGHEAKVFRVRWSPIRDGYLCSGSDDNSIRIWDYRKDECIGKLCRHKQPVRGLVWHPEIAHLLISGSWDSTIRVWDIETLTCLETIYDHQADVYGLHIHRARPFLMISSSRDSTLRFWSLSRYGEVLYSTLLIKKSLKSIILPLEDKSDTTHCPLLSGTYSREILLKYENTDWSTLIRIMSEYFSISHGVANLWMLVDVINGMDAQLLPEKYRYGIVHSSHLIKFKNGEAFERERKKDVYTGLTSLKREQRLSDAADAHIKIGNIQRYCEIMIELGEVIIS